jgi:hypothetical protein
VIAAAIVALAVQAGSLPDDCNLAGWSFCVALPEDGTAELIANRRDFVVYRFELPDGSSMGMYVGWAPNLPRSPGRGWAWRRQGVDNVRWLRDDAGRTDYVIERPHGWGPASFHFWTLPSPDGAISDARALAASVRTCGPDLCQDPGRPEPDLQLPQRPAE